MHKFSGNEASSLHPKPGFIPEMLTEFVISILNTKPFVLFPTAFISEFIKDYPTTGSSFRSSWCRETLKDTNKKRAVIGDIFLHRYLASLKFFIHGTYMYTFLRITKAVCSQSGKFVGMGSLEKQLQSHIKSMRVCVLTGRLSRVNKINNRYKRCTSYYFIPVKSFLFNE